LASDNFYATALNIGPGQGTKRLTTGTHGFDIPDTACIVGVKVTCEYKDPGPGLNQFTVRLTTDGVNPVAGSYQKDFPTATGTDQTQTVGSDTDDWNAGLTPADVNSTNFGAMILATQGAEMTGSFAYVDFIEVEVCYTLCNVTVVNPVSTTISVDQEMNFTASGTCLGSVQWSTSPAGIPSTGTGKNLPPSGTRPAPRPSPQAAKELPSSPP